MLYQDKYVAFIDMLGFSALVQESAADMSKLDENSRGHRQTKEHSVLQPSNRTFVHLLQRLHRHIKQPLSCWPCRHPELHQNVGREPASG